MEKSPAYQLYHYFRSSCSYRVRIALNFKNLACEFHPIELRKNEQNKADYLDLNPQGIVPSLITPDGTLITQSLAIIEYLEELHPTPALLPKNPELRAKIRAFAQAIACEVHPVNNLRVLNYLKNDLNINEPQVNLWYQHWVNLTFISLEKIAKLNAGDFCFGGIISLADLALIPQIYNARRYHTDMTAYPYLTQIEQNCLEHPAFQKAHPDNYLPATAP